VRQAPTTATQARFGDVRQLKGSVVLADGALAVLWPKNLGDPPFQTASVTLALHRRLHRNHRQILPRPFPLSSPFSNFFHYFL
jgi:hypothetical protein